MLTIKMIIDDFFANHLIIEINITSKRFSIAGAIKSATSSKYVRSSLLGDGASDTVSTNS